MLSAVSKSRKAEVNMSVRVAINGFGRVGRSIIRACLGRKDIEIVAVNTRAKPEILAHLLTYDSVHGKIKAEVSLKNGSLVVDGKEIRVTNITDSIDRLPWKDMQVDVVMESTGKFRKKDQCLPHIAAGAKKSSSRHRERASTAPFAWVSTRKPMTRRNITSFRMLPAPQTASPPS